MVQQKQFNIVSKDYGDWKRARIILDRGYDGGSDENDWANDTIWEYASEIMIGNKTKAEEKQWMTNWASDCDMVWDQARTMFDKKDEYCEGCNQHWHYGTCTCDWCDQCGCRTSNGGQGCTC
jgi:hypothetical protein